MIRNKLYKAARLLGDLRAIKRGRVPQRIVRRIIYRHAFRAAGWLSRMLEVGR